MSHSQLIILTAIVTLTQSLAILFSPAIPSNSSPAVILCLGIYVRVSVNISSMVVFFQLRLRTDSRLVIGVKVTNIVVVTE